MSSPGLSLACTGHLENRASRPTAYHCGNGWQTTPACGIVVGGSTGDIVQQTTSGYIGLAIAIALAMWLVLRPSGFQHATYKRANSVGILATIAAVLLLLWVARRIILPNFFDM